MIESHICDGDFVIIRRNSELENNTIVVANVYNADTETGGLTIKRLRDNQLVPENGSSDVPPIDVTSNVQILGTFTGVIRKSQPKKQRKPTKKPKQ